MDSTSSRYRLKQNKRISFSKLIRFALYRLKFDRCLKQVAVRCHVKFSALQIDETARDAQAEPASFAVGSGSVSAHKAFCQLLAGDIERGVGNVAEGDQNSALANCVREINPRSRHRVLHDVRQQIREHAP